MKKIIPVLAFILCMALSPFAHRQKPLVPFRYDFAPSKGELKLLVILMRFPEDEPEVSHERFEDIFFSKGKMPGGSAAEYFHEVSYGKLKITGKVRGWYTAEHPHAFYARGYHGHNAGIYPGHQSRLVEEAVKTAEKDGVDFSIYDNSGDGHVDGLIVIHSGRGGSTSGNKNHIWTTAHYLSMGGTNSIEVNGKIIDRYSIIQEKRRAGLEVPIGFICHELGHIMGLPDLGDKDSNSGGIGKFCSMGTGFWGKHDPTRPFHFCAWSKAKLGWIEPELITGNTVIEIPDIETHPVAYRLNTSSHDEYFLISNRQAKGYDSEMFGKGVLIWHVDERVLTENNRECIGLCPYHYIVALEQADGKNHLEKNKNYGDAGDFFSMNQGASRRWAADTGAGKDFLDGAHSITYNGDLTGLCLALLDSTADEIKAKIQVNDSSHPSQSSPLISIADFRLEFSAPGKHRKKTDKQKFGLFLKIRNIGAPAKKIKVTAQAQGIWFSSAKAALASLDTGEQAWLDEPFVFRTPAEFGPGRTVRFRFSLTSNRGSYSVVMGKPVPAGLPEIMLLDDSQRRIGSLYSERLAELKKTTWKRKVYETGLPTPAEIERFPILIWLAPLHVTEGGNVLDSRRKALLQNYLEQGGNLLLAAPHLEFSGDEFFSNVLHIEAARPEAGIAGIIGNAGDVISRNQRTMTGNFYYPRINPHSSIKPAAEAAIIYHDLHGHIVGVRYPAQKEAGHKLVVLSFPLEALGPWPQREVIRRILRFFQMPFGAPVADRLTPSSFPKGTDHATVNVSGINFQQGINAGFEQKDLRVENIRFIGPEKLEIILEIKKTAPPGPRTLTLTNPGMETQKFPKAIKITQPATRQK